jgi:hypothetical protein
VWFAILAAIGFLVLWRSVEEGRSVALYIYVATFLSLYAYGWWVRRGSRRG